MKLVDIATELLLIQHPRMKREEIEFSSYGHDLWLRCLSWSEEGGNVTVDIDTAFCDEEYDFTVDEIQTMAAILGCKKTFYSIVGHGPYFEIPMGEEKTLSDWTD